VETGHEGHRGRAKTLPELGTRERDWQTKSATSIRIYCFFVGRAEQSELIYERSVGSSSKQESEREGFYRAGMRPEHSSEKERESSRSDYRFSEQGPEDSERSGYGGKGESHWLVEELGKVISGVG